MNYKDKRREYNKTLVDGVNGKITVYNLEDMWRLVGVLNYMEYAPEKMQDKLKAYADVLTVEANEWEYEQTFPPEVPTDDQLKSLLDQLLQEAEETECKEYAGELLATAMHLSSILYAGENNFYCVYKHTATAYIIATLAGILPQVPYDVVDIISGGRIKACKACTDDASINEGKLHELTDD